MQSSSVGPAVILSLLFPPSCGNAGQLDPLFPGGGGRAVGEKKKGNWRFSCRDRRLGKAETPGFRFLEKRERGSEEVVLALAIMDEGSAGGVRSKEGWLKLEAAAAEAAAAMVEKQDTCSDGAWLS